MDRVEFIKKMRQAIQNNDLSSVKQLLDEDMEKLNLVLPTGGWLNIAITYQAWDIMEYLLEKGIDKDILLPSNKGNALSTAATFGSPQLLKYLMEKGYGLICECDKSNPIFAALSGNKVENIQFLLDLEKKKITEEQYLQLCEMLITEARRISNNQVLELMNIEITQDEPIQKLIIDKKMLINLLKEAMNKFMQDVMKAYVEEEVYIVSVEIEPKEYKCYWYVNTKENLNDKVQKTNGKNKWYYYFCENEWDIIENSPDYFDEFTKYIQRECKYKFDIIELYEVFVDAIVEFKKEKIFNEICRNDIIFALNAYERCSQKDIVEFFKKMNKDEDCKNYIDNIKEFF